MDNILLTIDWDYFMPYISQFNVSVLENRRNIDKHWYKLYLENKQIGRDITKTMRVGSAINDFWDKLNKKFIFRCDKLIVTESHKEAYNTAKEYECNKVYNIDAHTDLGYGGVESLQFEVNCANWLGKLLKDNIIDDAEVILSPYTGENKEDFKEINEKYNVGYKTINEVPSAEVIKAIHICRSGAWTAPWLDNEFNKFIKSLDKTVEYREIVDRYWNIENITLSQQIDYMLFN